MNTTQVVNIKCGGCRNTVISGLQKEGFSNVDVNIETQEVSFEGDIEKAKTLLSKMGYPEATSEEARSMMKKAKSYVSCAVGKM